MDTEHWCFVDTVALGFLQPAPSPLLHPEEQSGKQGDELGGDVHVHDNPSCPAQLAEHSAGCWDWKMNISVWVDLKNRDNIIGEKANPEKLSYGWNWPSSELEHSEHSCEYCENATGRDLSSIPFQTPKPMIGAREERELRSIPSPEKAKFVNCLKHIQSLILILCL